MDGCNDVEKEMHADILLAASHLTNRNGPRLASPRVVHMRITVFYFIILAAWNVCFCLLSLSLSLSLLKAAPFLSSSVMLLEQTSSPFSSSSSYCLLFLRLFAASRRPQPAAGLALTLQFNLENGETIKGIERRRRRGRRRGRSECRRLSCFTLHLFVYT